MTAKKHNQGFLDLVNDAKSRVREINIEVQKMAACGSPSWWMCVKIANGRPGTLRARFIWVRA